MTQMRIRPALAYLETAATLPAVSVMALRVAVVVAKWSERQRSRRDLEQLDSHALRDVGLTEGQALHEAAKPFWRG